VIQSNIPKFVIAGGRPGLFEKIRRHFDPSYSPSGLDVAPLVNEIPLAILTTEYGDFIRDLFALTGDLDGDEYEQYIASEELGELLSSIKALNDPRLEQALAEEIQRDSSFLIAVLLRVPNLVLLFSRSPSFVRKLWSDRLPFGSTASFRFVVKSLWVVVVMLRSGLIPEAQVREALAHIVRKIHEGYPHPDYSADLLSALEPFGLWEVVRRVISVGRVEWVATNLSLAIEYLERFPVDVDVARAFAMLVPEGTVTEDPYLPGAKFYMPEDGHNLAGWLSEHQDKLKEILRLASANGINVARFRTFMEPFQSQAPDTHGSPGSEGSDSS
jgi:hypothetical protein